MIAESFERIHRSNLVGMGVLPLQLDGRASRESIGLSGRERFTIRGLSSGLQPRPTLEVEARSDDGSVRTFPVVARLDNTMDLAYLRHGGILPMVLRQLR